MVSAASSAPEPAGAGPLSSKPTKKRAAKPAASASPADVRTAQAAATVGAQTAKRAKSAGQTKPVREGKAGKAAKPSKAVKSVKPLKAVKPVKAVKVDKPSAVVRASAVPAGGSENAAGASSAVAVQKPHKHKLVRDSFTIPRAEYQVLDTLKQRLIQLARPAKKSEVLRAGIKLLNSLPDAALRDALAAVPEIKTGRPKKAR